MINELFPFQKMAVNELRTRAAMALSNYRTFKVPQVISLQAPTGSGKTIIMASFIEDVYFGSEMFAEQPNAVFVWLSDSPQLNEQSKQKIDTKADKIRLDQCVIISDESFDQELLEDGHIYFLNTQKLGKGGNLSYHSDTRQYTIWETIENTAKEKPDRLYFIIDEAHRGMQGREAGKATSIMQRFIKGSPAHKLSPVPFVIGMSATADRFTALVGDTTSTLSKVVISPTQVRASGLLKDRIIITYPDNPDKHNDMAVLQAAADEWIDKCKHWYQYTYEQHYANVNPVLVIQVAAGSDKSISNTDLDDVIIKVEERIHESFKEGEVVHTFGSTGVLDIAGLKVPHVEPSDIADNRKIRVVLFKENLSTGWDCPRAETMMSFRHAEDATYIAQLLGRMIRTPLQCHIMVDDSLNDVRLFLPYFNKSTVKDVIDALQNAEGGEIPAVVDSEAMEDQVYVTWTVNPRKTKSTTPSEGQINVFTTEQIDQADKTSTETELAHTTGQSQEVSETPYQQALPQKTPLPTVKVPVKSQGTEEKPANSSELVQLSFTPIFDRKAVIRFINEQGYLTYIVRSTKINSYLKSLLSLAGLLTQYQIYKKANDDVTEEVMTLIRNYIQKLHDTGKYNELAKQVLEFRLSIQIFDVFGEAISNYSANDLYTTGDSDLDRQLRAADTKLGSYGFPYKYGRAFFNEDDPNAFKVDCILFAADDNCIRQLNTYAEKKFHEFNDKYRKYVVSKSESCREQYRTIIRDGDEVSEHNFSLPETISIKLEPGTKEYGDHLFADDDGIARIKLNDWETDVLSEEQRRDDFVCWMRNPPRQSWSLCIPYEMSGEIKPTYPDFIIVRKDPELDYVLDILEPHNPAFKDNLGKAKGFAMYADKEQRIGRMQLIRTGKDAAGKTRFKRLDLARGEVRKKVLAAVNNDELDHIFDTDGEFED